MSLGLASILLVGIGAQFPNPGFFTQVNFAAGATTGAPAGQTVLLMGNKTSAGAATVDTVVYGPDTSTPVQTETDVITQFGAGSQLHRGWRRFTKVNKTTPVYLIAAAESTGTAALGVVQVVGTSATSAGNIRFFYGDEFVDTSVASGDLQTTIGANIATSINNNVNWAITASNSSGTITITAKNKGPEGNWLKIGVLAGPGFAPGGITVNTTGVAWITATVYPLNSYVIPTAANGYYYKATAISGTGTSGGVQPTWPTTIGTTVVDNTGANQITWTCWGTTTGAGVTSLGGGATADNYTNALATVLSQGYFNIVPCDSDATNVGRIATQIATQAQPITGILQRMFFGSADTLANCTTITTGLNSAQAECVWGNATDITPLELAANNAALYSLFEQSGNTGYRFVGRLNFSLFPTANATFNDASYWFLSGTRSGPNSGPNTVQITSALNNGITPIALQQNGAAYLVKRVTTRCLNGSNQDFRIRDAHKVAIMFAWATAAKNITQQQFGGKDLLDPPLQGQSPAGGQPPNTFATNTVLWGNALKDLTAKMGQAGLLQNVAATNAAAIIQREVSPRTRMSASFDLTTADIADQFCTVANQVG